MDSLDKPGLSALVTGHESWRASVPHRDIAPSLPVQSLQQENGYDSFHNIREGFLNFVQYLEATGPVCREKSGFGGGLQPERLGQPECLIRGIRRGCRSLCRRGAQGCGPDKNGDYNRLQPHDYDKALSINIGNTLAFPENFVE